MAVAATGCVYITRTTRVDATTAKLHYHRGKLKTDKHCVTVALYTVRINESINIFTWITLHCIALQWKRIKFQKTYTVWTLEVIIIQQPNWPNCPLNACRHVTKSSKYIISFVDFEQAMLLFWYVIVFLVFISAFVCFREVNYDLCNEIYGSICFNCIS